MPVFHAGSGLKTEAGSVLCWPGIEAHLEGEDGAVVGEVVGGVAWGLHHEAGACAGSHVGAGIGILVVCSSTRWS